jgi:predicted MPP superfamily phosphohydrolase
MSVTWLHISDLHLRSGESYDRDVVLRALVRSVRAFREQDGRAPDLIFATGDIAHSGAHDEYVVATRFFDELLGAAGLSRAHLYVVPGNHDVDRTLGSQLSRTLYSRGEADGYFDPNIPKLHLTQKLGAFLRWHQSYFEGIREMPSDSTCGPAEAAEVQGHRIGVLPINTALFCGVDGDHEKLFVGRRCLDPALEDLENLKVDLKIALLHHPPEFLSPLERQQIRAGLIDHVDIILTGHLHEAGIAGIDMWTGRNLYCAAGAAYQTRDWPNTAYYATFHGDRVARFPICDVDRPREVWTLDPSLFPHESGYQASFPVPRDPSFRSFRLPGPDGVFRPPAQRVGGFAPSTPSTVGPQPIPARGIDLMAVSDDTHSRKRRARTKTRKSDKPKRKRKG